MIYKKLDVLDTNLMSLEMHVRHHSVCLKQIHHLPKWPPALFISLCFCHEVAILNRVIYADLIEKVVLEQDRKEGMELVSN